jgi:hypothetical protein
MNSVKFLNPGKLIFLSLTFLGMGGCMMSPVNNQKVEPKPISFSGYVANKDLPVEIGVKPTNPGIEGMGQVAEFFPSKTPAKFGYAGGVELDKDYDMNTWYQWNGTAQINWDMWEQVSGQNSLQLKIEALQGTNPLATFEAGQTDCIRQNGTSGRDILQNCTRKNAGEEGDQYVVTLIAPCGQVGQYCCKTSTPCGGSTCGTDHICH